MFLRKSIKIPIYVGRFDIVITDSVTEYKKVYTDNHLSHDIYGHSIQTRTHKSDKTVWAMVLNFNSDVPITHGVIAHEALHVTAFILDWVNQDFDHNNHECFRYLIQWVTDEVYKFLDHHNLQVSCQK